MTHSLHEVWLFESMVTFLCQLAYIDQRVTSGVVTYLSDHQ